MVEARACDQQTHALTTNISYKTETRKKTKNRKGIQIRKRDKDQIMTLPSWVDFACASPTNPPETGGQ